MRQVVKLTPPQQLKDRSAAAGSHQLSKRRGSNPSHSTPLSQPHPRHRLLYPQAFKDSHTHHQSSPHLPSKRSSHPSSAPARTRQPGSPAFRPPSQHQIPQHASSATNANPFAPPWHFPPPQHSPSLPQHHHSAPTQPHQCTDPNRPIPANLHPWPRAQQDSHLLHDTSHYQLLPKAIAGDSPEDPPGDPPATGVAAQVHSQILLDTIIAGGMLSAAEASIVSMPESSQPNIADQPDHALPVRQTASRQKAIMGTSTAEGMQAKRRKPEPLQLELQQWCLPKKVVQVHLNN